MVPMCRKTTLVCFYPASSAELILQLELCFWEPEIARLKHKISATKEPELC